MVSSAPPTIAVTKAYGFGQDGRVEVEDGQLAAWKRRVQPAEPDPPEQHPDAHQRAEHVQRHLQEVGPHDGLDATDVGVGDGDRGDRQHDDEVVCVHAELGPAAA